MALLAPTANHPDFPVPQSNQSTAAAPSNNLQIELDVECPPAEAPTTLEALDVQCATLDGQCTPAEAPSTLEALNARFPLPARTEAYYAHSLCPSVTIPVSILVIDGVGDAVGLGIDSLPDSWRWACVVCMQSEMIVALVLYTYIMCADAGEVRRIQESCFPLPGEVSEWMKDQTRSSPQELLTANPERDTGCCAGRLSSDVPMHDTDTRIHNLLRCFVWRPPGSHHCSICQRCVIGFDHHCAGTSRS